MPTSCTNCSFSSCIEKRDPSGDIHSSSSAKFLYAYFCLGKWILYFCSEKTAWKIKSHIFWHRFVCQKVWLFCCFETIKNEFWVDFLALKSQTKSLSPQKSYKKNGGISSENQAFNPWKSPPKILFFSKKNRVKTICAILVKMGFFSSKKQPQNFTLNNFNLSKSKLYKPKIGKKADWFS